MSDNAAPLDSRFLGLALRGFGADPKQRRDGLLFHALVPVALGSILGANQTGIAFYLPWALSVAYWIILSVLTWQVLHWLTAAFAYLTRPVHLPLTVVLIAGAMLTTFIMRPFMYTYSGWFEDFLHSGRNVQPMPEFRWELDFFLHHLQLWAGVLVVWVSINMIFDRFVGSPRYRPANIAPRLMPVPDNAPETKADSHAPAPATVFGLPIGSTVLALKAEDHYVRVFSDRGEKLLLLRISDAIAALGAVEGARVHRSYWVAKSAVERSEAHGRNVTLYLKNGVQVPVSQTYKEFARQAGLLSSL
jgi:hypothetical protein